MKFVTNKIMSARIFPDESCSEAFPPVHLFLAEPEGDRARFYVELPQTIFARLYHLLVRGSAGIGLALDVRTWMLKEISGLPISLLMDDADNIVAISDPSGLYLLNLRSASEWEVM